MKALAATAILMFAYAAYAADTDPPPDCSSDKEDGLDVCPSENEIKDIDWQVSDDGTIFAQHCQTTIKRYLMALDSNQMCHIRTCCKTTCPPPGTPNPVCKTKCWDKGVGCITVTFD